MINELSDNPEKFSNQHQGGFERCDEKGYSQLEKIIGKKAISFIKGNENLVLYKRVTIPGNYFGKDNLFILKAYEWAVFLSIRNDRNTGTFNNLEINFTFWEELAKFGKIDYKASEDSLRNDTLKFLKTIFALLLEIDESCPVEFSGVDEQRDALWKKVIEKLKKIGRKNIKMKAKVVISFKK